VNKTVADVSLMDDTGLVFTPASVSGVGHPGKLSRSKTNSYATVTATASGLGPFVQASVDTTIGGQTAAAHLHYDFEVLDGTGVAGAALVPVSFAGLLKLSLDDPLNSGALWADSKLVLGGFGPPSAQYEICAQAACSFSCPAAACVPGASSFDFTPTLLVPTNTVHYVDIYSFVYIPDGRVGSGDAYASLNLGLDRSNPSWRDYTLAVSPGYAKPPGGAPHLAVPEPAAWATLLLGFAMLGAQARTGRRRLTRPSAVPA
jgi:hypothetical protein